MIFYIILAIIICIAIILAILIPNCIRNNKESYGKEKIDWVIGWISPNQIGDNENIQRFRDNNELKYCLRSICAYAPWFNKIHIILGRNSKPPKWLKTNNRIQLVSEKELYKPVQPNSETKKLFYADIPGLSDLFITTDDDFFLGKKVFKEDFFNKNNKPILNSVHNNYDGWAHIPLAWNKKDYKKSVSSLPDKLKKSFLTMGNERLNPWVFLKKYLLKNNLSIKGKITKPDVWLTNKSHLIYGKFYPGNTRKTFQVIIKSKPKFICINDDWETRDVYLYRKQYQDLQKFFNTFYPHKCEFEY